MSIYMSIVDVILIEKKMIKLKLNLRVFACKEESATCSTNNRNEKDTLVTWKANARDIIGYLCSISHL